MIVSDIVTRVRRTFGDEAAVQVSNDDIIRWINDAQIEIVKNNDSALQKTDTINLVANQASYSLPADLLILRSMRYKMADMQSYLRLIYKSMQQFDEIIDGWDGTSFNADRPQYVTIFENKAILFPTPDTSATAGLKVLYNQKPTDVVTTGDSISLPLIYHNVIVTYCMWQASLLDEDLEPAQMYRGEFQSSMGLLQDRENKDATSLYPTITVLDDDL